MYRENTKNGKKVFIESEEDVKIVNLEAIIDTKKIINKEVDKIRIEKLEKHLSYNILRTVPCLIIKDMKKLTTKLVKCSNFDLMTDMEGNLIDSIPKYACKLYANCVKIERDEILDVAPEMFESLEKSCLCVVINENNSKCKCKEKKSKKVSNNKKHKCCKKNESEHQLPSSKRKVKVDLTDELKSECRDMMVIKDPDLNNKSEKLDLNMLYKSLTALKSTLKQINSDVDVILNDLKDIKEEK